MKTKPNSPLHLTNWRPLQLIFDRATNKGRFLLNTEEKFKFALTFLFVEAEREHLRAYFCHHNIEEELGLKAGNIIGKILYKPYKPLQLVHPFDCDLPQLYQNWYHVDSITSGNSTEDSSSSSSGPSFNVPPPAKLEIDISAGILSVSDTSVVNAFNYNSITAHLNIRVPRDPLINSTISFTNNSLQAYTTFSILPSEFPIFGSCHIDTDTDDIWIFTPFPTARIKNLPLRTRLILHAFQQSFLHINCTSSKYNFPIGFEFKKSRI